MSIVAIAGIEVARALARPLPIAWVSAVGGMVGRWLMARGKRQRRVMANLQLAFPQKTEQERAGIARAMWDNYGRTLAETLILDRIAADPGRIELANPQVLDGDPGGVVFVGMHYGNWECNVLAARNLFPDIAGIYKPFTSPRFEAWVRAKRAPFYPGGILRGDATALLKAARHVRGGGAVCVLADHRDLTGHEVSFLDRPAPSSAFPALLGRRFGARVIVARADRMPGARFRVTLAEVPVAQSGQIQDDVAQTTQDIQTVLETWVRNAPESWLWFYKRWTENPLI